jgi:hypothetical protein
MSRGSEEFQQDAATHCKKNCLLKTRNGEYREIRAEKERGVKAERRTVVKEMA